MELMAACPSTWPEFAHDDDNDCEQGGSIDHKSHWHQHVQTQAKVEINSNRAGGREGLPPPTRLISSTIINS